MKKEVKKYLVIIMLGIVAISLIVSIYFIVNYSKTCRTETCFSNALIECKRVNYIRGGDETIIGYSILGKKDGKCEVNVKLLQVKKGSADLYILENKEMVCLVQLGVYRNPEENIKNCHGLLKESIQEIMIARMHAQIVENIGDIGLEATKII